MTLTEEIHKRLVQDLKDKNIKAWQIKRGTSPNPYPIARTYVWFLSKEEHMDKVGLPSLLILKQHFDNQELSK